MRDFSYHEILSLTHGHGSQWRHLNLSPSLNNQPCELFLLCSLPQGKGVFLNSQLFLCITFNTHRFTMNV